MGTKAADNQSIGDKQIDSCEIWTHAGYPNRFLVYRLNHSAKLSVEDRQHSPIQHTPQTHNRSSTSKHTTLPPILSISIQILSQHISLEFDYSWAIDFRWEILSNKNNHGRNVMLWRDMPCHLVDYGYGPTCSVLDLYTTVINTHTHTHIHIHSTE